MHLRKKEKTLDLNDHVGPKNKREGTFHSLEQPELYKKSWPVLKITNQQTHRKTKTHTTTHKKRKNTYTHNNNPPMRKAASPKAPPLTPQNQIDSSTQPFCKVYTHHSIPCKNLVKLCSLTVIPGAEGEARGTPTSTQILPTKQVATPIAPPRRGKTKQVATTTQKITPPQVKTQTYHIALTNLTHHISDNALERKHPREEEEQNARKEQRTLNPSPTHSPREVIGILNPTFYKTTNTPSLISQWRSLAHKTPAPQHKEKKNKEAPRPETSPKPHHVRTGTHKTLQTNKTPPQRKSYKLPEESLTKVCLPKTNYTTPPHHSHRNKTKKLIYTPIETERQLLESMAQNTGTQEYHLTLDSANQENLFPDPPSPRGANQNARTVAERVQQRIEERRLQREEEERQREEAERNDPENNPRVTSWEDRLLIQDALSRPHAYERAFVNRVRATRDPPLSPIPDDEVLPVTPPPSTEMETDPTTTRPGQNGEPRTRDVSTHPPRTSAPPPSRNERRTTLEEPRGTRQTPIQIDQPTQQREDDQLIAPQNYQAGGAATDGDREAINQALLNMWSEEEDKKYFLILDRIPAGAKYSDILRTYGSMEGYSPVHSQVDSKAKCAYVVFTLEESFDEAYLLPPPYGEIRDRTKYDVNAKPGAWFRLFMTTAMDNNTFTLQECVNAAVSKRIGDRTETNCNPDSGCATAYTSENRWLQIHQPPAKPIVVKYTARQLLDKGVSPLKFKNNCVDWKRDILTRTAHEYLLDQNDIRYEWVIPALYPPTHPKYREYTYVQKANILAFYRHFGVGFLSPTNKDDVTLQYGLSEADAEHWAFKLEDGAHFLNWEEDSHMNFYTPTEDDHLIAPKAKLIAIPNEDRTRDPMMQFRIESFNWDGIMNNMYSKEKNSRLSPLLNLVIVNAFAYCNVPHLVKLYAKGLPYFASEEQVTEIFKTAEPSVEVVGVYRDKATNKNFGFGFLYVRGTIAAERLIKHPLPAPKGRTINFEYAKERKKENTFAAPQARGGAAW